MSYESGVDGLRLVSVPLELADTVQICKTADPSCSLMKARNMLASYLDQQRKLEHDLQQDHQVTLSEVITAYEEAVGTIRAAGKPSLLAQALHELGNLHFYRDNLRGAYACWADAADVLLKKTDVINNWRMCLTAEELGGAALLARCGVWGCLLAGILVTDVARYVLKLGLALRTETCLLAAALFRAVFGAALPCLRSDEEFVNAAGGSVDAVPSIELLSDHGRCNPATLVTCLMWLGDELTKSHHFVAVIPVLLLQESVARRLQLWCEWAAGQTTLVRVVTNLGRYCDAVIILHRLFNPPLLADTPGATHTPRFHREAAFNNVDNIEVLKL
ncbi:PREDICTED: cilia- and flagella-associated protein 54-like [Priapulus caudatus]|uniref:Cilia- and flagella-associated protein 54-like n=1 Tax=Priapulus caudatus TaxID=37621 RepID=A0ABM1DRI5_PRICU|nr:PREDICTED: cilia- and flagella-associated protein 54-like [Priapulus caudatus]